MSNNDGFVNSMKPKKGDRSIDIPVTFDYSGGRGESNKSKLIWVAVLIVATIIFAFGTLFSKDGFFITNILLTALIVFGMSTLIRFPIMKEHKVRNDMLEMLDSDYKMGTDEIWGIYSIDDSYPYYAHLRSGYTALFVRFEKDVILGRVTDTEYEHYEAIGDAYNLAGAFKMGMCHIDYMDLIGNDSRIDSCFSSLIDVENTDIREILTDVYTNLQETMNSMVTTSDVYVFTFKYSESTFWYHIQKVISCMLEANYVSFTILDGNALRNLSKSLFNLHEFSVIEASSSIFGSDKMAGVVPISVEKVDGTFNKLNLTTEEKKVEFEMAEQRKRQGKKPVKNTKDDEDILNQVVDIF